MNWSLRNGILEAIVVNSNEVVCPGRRCRWAFRIVGASSAKGTKSRWVTERVVFDVFERYAWCRSRLVASERSLICCLAVLGELLAAKR
jgi:hypothetical protein